MVFGDSIRTNGDSTIEGDGNYVQNIGNFHRTNKNVNIQQTEPNTYTRLKRAKTRYSTVELPVMLTALPILLMRTFEAEYIREQISTEKNYSESENNCTAAGTSRGIEDEIQSETSRWLLYLGISYALPSKL